MLKTYIANNQHNYAKTNDSSFNKIKFKDDLEILIRIFFFNKYLREKENSSFTNLNKGKSMWSSDGKEQIVMMLINNNADKKMISGIWSFNIPFRFSTIAYQTVNAINIAKTKKISWG